MAERSPYRLACWLFGHSDVIKRVGSEWVQYRCTRCRKILALQLRGD